MIRIGKVINGLLGANEIIKEAVGIKIYPILAAEETQPPFIVYKRTAMKPSYSKDGLYGDDGTVQIDVISQDYAEGVDIMQAVRQSLEWQRGVFYDVNVDMMLVDSANEYGDGKEFIQELVLKIIINH